MIKVSRGCLGEEELAGAKEAFDYGYFGHAHNVLEFEDELKKYIGANHLVAVNTGTSALHLAVDALGIGPGDEVIVPSLTFVASFHVVTATGARPVPCDIYPDTLSIDLEDVERRITDRTRAVMPVHYAGSPCKNFDLLLEIAEEKDLRVVEDAAHAFGSSCRGRKIGSFGDVTCFSFDSIKNITCGEGGAVLCRDEELAEEIRLKRILGIDRKSHTFYWKDRTSTYDVKTLGYRYHMSNINAAIGLAQLKKVDAFITRRREICRIYDSAFRELPGIGLLDIDYEETAPHIYVIRVRNGRRNELADYLKQKDIETGINYVPNHFHSMYRDENASLPETEKAYEEILTLPLHCGLSDNDVGKVIEDVSHFITKYS